LKTRLPKNPVVNDKEAIDKGIDELTSAIQQATAAVANHDRPCSKSPGQPLPEVGDCQMNEWTEGQTVERCEDHSLWKMKKWVLRVPTPSVPLQVLGRLTLSDSEKAKVMADSLEDQFQPVDDPSDLEFIEIVYEAVRAYKYAPSSNLSKVLQALKWLKYGKAPGPKGVPNRVLQTSTQARSNLPH
jgi:hypothetical protein